MISEAQSLDLLSVSFFIKSLKEVRMVFILRLTLQLLIGYLSWLIILQIKLKD